MQKRWLGAVVAVVLAVHALSMGRENLPHMLWSCHVASALIAVGMLLGRRSAVAVGFLFHVAVGFPAWSIEMIVTGGRFDAPQVVPHILATSALAHTVPMLAAGLYLWPLRLPWMAPWGAWIIQVGMVPVARWLTPPGFNVNLSHAVYPALRGAFSSWLIFHVTVAAVTLASLLAFWLALRRPGGDQPA